MKTIDVTGQSNNTGFTATYNGETIGTLKYTKWYSQMAVITIGQSTYQVCPAGFWNFRYEIIKEGELWLTVTNSWSGYKAVKAHDEGRPMTITPKGFFKGGYVIKNHKEEVLLEVHSDFSWKKFTQDYRITCDDAFGIEETDKVLVLLSVYFYIAAQAAATGAA
jgi:hypothetical protein